MIYYRHISMMFSESRETESGETLENLPFLRKCRRCKGFDFYPLISQAKGQGNLNIVCFFIIGVAFHRKAIFFILFYKEQVYAEIFGRTAQSGSDNQRLSVGLRSRDSAHRRGIVLHD